MYDIITIGSATVDVFVKTKKQEIMKHGEHEDVCYAIGQKILVDDLHVDTGGGGTNTAVAFSRLGLKTGWIGKVGDDLHAKTVLDEMEREKVSVLGTSGKGMTGYSVILTGLEKNRTILAFKGINDKLAPAEVPWSKLKTKWFYFSSMMNKSFDTLKRAAEHAKKNKIKYAFNPSMYLAKQGVSALKPILDGCDLLVLNKEEALAVIGKQGQAVRVEEILASLQRHAKIVVVTDGPRIVHAYDGNQHYQLIPTDVKIIETTGAGDAFASGIVAGLIMGKDLKSALQHGMAESGSVIQHIGSKQKLLKRAEIAGKIRAKPAKITVSGL